MTHYFCSVGVSFSLITHVMWHAQERSIGAKERELILAIYFNLNEGEYEVHSYLAANHFYKTTARSQPFIWGVIIVEIHCS